MNQQHVFLSALFCLFLPWMSLQAQNRTKALILPIDTREMLTDPISMGNIVRMEVEKINRYEVIDRYDMLELLGNSAIDPNQCFSTSCLLQAAQQTGADWVIGGYAERIGEKLILNLKLINAQTKAVERTEIGEFVNREPQIEQMAQIVVMRLLDLSPEAILTDNLAYYPTFENVPTTRIINNGPRMGVGYLIGDMAQRFEAPIEEGGYDAYPYISQFGYQHEIEYLSAGNFQALIEVLGLVSGLEQSMFIPSVVVMNGFRENKHGFEFAFGPSFSVRRMADGYFGDDGRWYLASQWDGPLEERPALTQQLDKRGNPEFFSRWVWSLGKTFRSGYLNIPVNVYASPRKDDWMIGLSVGFNVRKGRQ
ncbi:MAG: hypothetical protein AAF388_00885 [Bacteroidota bacterium]